MSMSQPEAGVLSLSDSEDSDFMRSHCRFAESGSLTTDWALNVVRYHGWTAGAARSRQRSPKREASRC
jgi:hypothetical protein